MIQIIRNNESEVINDDGAIVVDDQMTSRRSGLSNRNSWVTKCITSKDPKKNIIYRWLV